MKLSADGVAFIESFEGWKKLMPDGRYCAYQERYHGKLDKPTIGPGLTEGVEMGMVWTREECEVAFRKELAKHESAINRLVTVDIGQNAFDALVSLSYNIGSGLGSKKGGVANSSVLSKLNSGDHVGAAHSFALYNKANGGIVEGLVRRRAMESALFMQPDSEDEPRMPQKVDAPPRKVHPAETAGKIATATTIVVEAFHRAVPTSIDDGLAKAQKRVDQGKQVKVLVQDTRELATSVKMFTAAPSPAMIGGSLLLVAVAAAALLLPKFWRAQ